MCRVVDGEVKDRRPDAGDVHRAAAEVLEIGCLHPRHDATAALATGEVGYVATGLKVVRECQVGDTITLAATPADQRRCPATGRSSRWSSPASIPVDSEEYGSCARRWSGCT